MNTPRTHLREMLAKPEQIVAPFVFDCLQANLAVSAGFDAIYMTGFGTASAHGYPDLGLLTMTEMAANARAISRSVNVPVICDADTGYGNPLNVWRTVREYEDAGVSALHIEDQVFPKRCGFFAGKQVIPLASMANKVRAACDARRDPDLVIIARTDALQSAGWDDVERRARAYRASGADLIFVDGIKTREELKLYAEKLGDLPLVYNGDLLPLDVSLQDNDPHRNDARGVRHDAHRDDRTKTHGQAKCRNRLKRIRRFHPRPGNRRVPSPRKKIPRLATTGLRSVRVQIPRALFFVSS